VHVLFAYFVILHVNNRVFPCETYRKSACVPVCVSAGDKPICNKFACYSAAQRSCKHSTHTHTHTQYVHVFFAYFIIFHIHNRVLTHNTCTEIYIFYIYTHTHIYIYTYIYKYIHINIIKYACDECAYYPATQWSRQHIAHTHTNTQYVLTVFTYFIILRMNIKLISLPACDTKKASVRACARLSESI